MAGRRVVLSTKVSPVERAALREEADAAGTTVSSLLRELAGPVIRRRLAASATGTTKLKRRHNPDTGRPEAAGAQADPAPAAR